MSNTFSNQPQPQAGPSNCQINTPLTQHNIQPLSNMSNNNLQTISYWTIATRNVRGLTEKTKRELWFQYCHQQNWDIVVSTVTQNMRYATIDQNTSLTIISDHKATTCRVENWQLDNTASPAHYKPNNRYHWGDTSEKQWEKFASYVDEKIEKQNYSNSSPNKAGTT